ncbi:carbamoyltransferase family protein [Salinactinospora qingdaonensis]|uniref:Carbamoyltransferase n=1 Tax=Salinactinospora qingdaonensis TaxID=702744 RepID=A0ABP7FT52_9ACTN
MGNAYLGIASFYHDSAATLVVDGVVRAAAQEERFTRRRHDPSFPKNAVAYCLSSAGLKLGDLEAVVYYEDPELKYDRVRSNFRSAGPRAFKAFVNAMPEWDSWKRNVLATVRHELSELFPGQSCEIRHSTHHRSHAASAFFPSPYEKAAVLTIDGVGEWETTSIWRGDGTALEQIAAIHYPHSLGFLYSAFTQYCGFKVDSGEYKLMGLAPYGRPRYADLVRDELIDLKVDGSFELNTWYFDYQHGQRMVGRTFERLFGRRCRTESEDIEQFHCDMAASVQQVTEEAVLGLARHAQEVTGLDHLVMAGGVALNCVANGVLDRTEMFRELWIQPAAGDAGCSLGAAMDASVRDMGKRPHLFTAGNDGMHGSLLGPEYAPEEIRRRLDAFGAVYEDHGEDVWEATAARLAEGDVVGWFQDRMEFGPRALGNRSILGDPRDTAMQRTMNLKIKYRESFRPFAPAVLDEYADEFFLRRSPSPYMLVVSDVVPHLRRETAGGLGSINDVRSTVPAVTHVDYSARVQTVTSTSNPSFHKLLSRFAARTGCPVLVNTSFNVRGEPIVMTPEHAYTCFMRTEMDTLAIGPFLLRKQDQPEFRDSQEDWRSEIPLD